MRYIYEALISRDEDSYLLEIPDLPGCFTWADSFEEVIRKAPDALETHVGSYLAAGEDVPKATFGHVADDTCTLLVVSFDASPASVKAPSVMASTAAERLSVSKGRVSQLLREGRLEGYRSGREVMVSESSINRLLSSRRGAGRPRKALMA